MNGREWLGSEANESLTFDYFHSHHSGTKPRRALGSETEYGIICPGQPALSPISSSTAVVLAYAKSLGLEADDRTRWDFSPEFPLRDTRGFDLGMARPTPSVNPNAPGLANLVLYNGGRFYVDHAHPEYSTPEVTDPLAAVVWDKAGDRIALRACQQLQIEKNGFPVVLYKNNVDGKGASYGTHENYTVARRIPFSTLAQALIPFFVTRIIYTGAGRVGIGPASEDAGYQISQRADYIETEISLETTLNRGIINTRDEPHADYEKWRRLHVIVGDGNMSEIAQYLKMGATSLVLDAIEQGEDFSDLALADPVRDFKRVSRDLGCSLAVELVDGRRLTAIEIQREYLERVGCIVGEKGSSFSDDRTTDILTYWDKVLNDLSTSPLETSDYLDWTAKLALLQGIKSRHNLAWDHPKLAALDLAYANTSPSGIFQKLVDAGRMKTLVKEEDIVRATFTPPPDTRAWLRGQMVERFGKKIVAAAWDRLIVSKPGGGYLTLMMSDPLTMTRNQVEEVLTCSEDALDIVMALQDAKKGES